MIEDSLRNVKLTLKYAWDTIVSQAEGCKHPDQLAEHLEAQLGMPCMPYTSDTDCVVWLLPDKPSSCLIATPDAHQHENMFKLGLVVANKYENLGYIREHESYFILPAGSIVQIPTYRTVKMFDTEDFVLISARDISVYWSSENAESLLFDN